MPDTDAPKKSRFAQRRDLLAAIASGFVGALALATSTYNVYLQRQQVRAQVWPRLVLDGSFNVGDTGTTFSLRVKNRGVGPAEVRRVRVSVDGIPAESWVEVEVKLLRAHDIRDSFEIQSLEGETLSPGLELTPFVSRRNARVFVTERKRLAVAVCYCSTLDECWEVSAKDLFQGSTTRPLSNCTPDDKPFESLAGDLLDEMAKPDDDAGRAAPPRDASR